MTASRIELTESDLFSSGNWNSAQVSVLGFHLGMSWPAALAKAREQKLLLWKAMNMPADDLDCAGSGLCSVFNAEGDDIGMTMTFGERREVVELSIELVPEGVPLYDKKTQVSLRFKGNTLKLFHQYSNELRSKLLGPEASKKEHLEDKSTTYNYPSLGVFLDSYDWGELQGLRFHLPTEKR